MKSIEYDDEQEVRAIVHDWPGEHGPSYLDPVPEAASHGYHIETALDQLISRVVVSPHSANLRDKINEALARTGLNIQAEDSTLTRRPFY